MQTAIFLAAIGLALGSYAVHTNECPEKFNATIQNMMTVPEMLKINDKDYATILQGTSRIQKNPSIELMLSLREKKNGKCLYSSNNGAAEIYSKDGRDILRVGGRWNHDILLGFDIYATITNLSVDDIQIESVQERSVFLYFMGKPSLYYDGGPERRSVGKASLDIELL